MAAFLRIGARGSALSLAQTRQLRALLAHAFDIDAERMEIVPISTTGDRIQDRALLAAGGKGLFTKELDEALRDGRIDLAVHSLKDVPTRLPDDIVLACVPAREDPRDAFISSKAASLVELAHGAVLGTASLRRETQSRRARPDLKIALLRGNVDTRLRKIENGEFDAGLLALAGLKRLGFEARARAIVDPDEAPPAPGQGALAITARSDDGATLAVLAQIEDPLARVEIEAERAFLAALDGSCRTAIGALGRAGGGALAFVGEALSPDGAASWRRRETIAIAANAVHDARVLGDRLGREIRAEAGAALTAGQA